MVTEKAKEWIHRKLAYRQAGMQRAQRNENNIKGKQKGRNKTEEKVAIGRC